ncbi:hypothetical protein LZT27_22290, partial [Aeromonas veronii]|uniref:hypothetical protein n=1 Tax=Aeromonas veronii TaxID=654 RepID=UPI002363541B
MQSQLYAACQCGSSLAAVAFFDCIQIELVLALITDIESNNRGDKAELGIARNSGLWLKGAGSAVGASTKNRTRITVKRY